MITIGLFGTFHISADGKPVVLPYRQTEAALIHLLVSHPDPVEKDLLAELLWPARPPGVARGNLRHAVHALRTTAGLKDILVSTNTLLSLERLDGMRCDYLDFRDLIRTAGKGARAATDAVRAAIGLYGNGLLETFGAEPSREYGFWLYTARRSCAKQLFSFLFAAIPDLCNRREDALLTEIAEFLVLREPYDTGLYEFLLRSLISRGEPRLADRIHRGASEVMGKGGDREAMNGLAEIARRIFPADSFPIKKRLPPPLLPLVGRREECTAVAALLKRPQVRLVTIAAPGGYGKTSLAVALAREIDASLFPDGIFFVSFRDCPDGNTALHRLLARLDVSNGGDPEEALLRYLGDRKLLLLFDELEGAPFVAGLIDGLLNRCAGMKILSTSRRELGLNVEWIYRLPPFGRIGEARELFTLTAERKTGKTSWTKEETGAVEEICGAVDGIPLAIELVASRIGAADGTALTGMLAHLVDSSAARMERMERIIEYQVGLLDGSARDGFPLLALFRDRFDREAACGAFRIDGAAFDGYYRLSLVWPAGKDMFRLHAPVRSWCLSLLRRTGRFEPGFRRLCSHLAEASHRHFLRLFSLAGDPLAIVERYAGELEEAWLHALRSGDWDMAMKIAIPMGSYLHYHGMTRKGQELFRVKLQEILDADPGDPGPGGYHGILHIALICTVLALQIDDRDYGLGLLETMRRLDARSGMGFLAEREGMEDPYRVYLVISFPWVEGLYALRAGDRARARDLFLESRRRAVRYSAPLCRVYVEIHLATVEFEKDPRYAMDLLENALRSNHGKHIVGIRSDIFLLLARFCMARERTEEAVAHAEAVLEEEQRRPSSRTEMEALFLLALLHVGRSTDREIPRMYLLRALQAAGKNGLFSIAVDSSLAFVHRWVDLFETIPDWETYESISALTRGPGMGKRKEDLDRLFGLA